MLNSTSLKKKMTMNHHQLLTGEQKVLLHQSRIKVNADHAGPFQLPAHWKVSPSSKPASSNHSLNNNWLIAQANTAIKDVTEDGCSGP